MQHELLGMLSNLTLEGSFMLTVFQISHTVLHGTSYPEEIAEHCSFCESTPWNDSTSVPKLMLFWEKGLKMSSSAYFQR